MNYEIFSQVSWYGCIVAHAGGMQRRYGAGLYGSQNIGGFTSVYRKGVEPGRYGKIILGDAIDLEAGHEGPGDQYVFPRTGR